MARTAARLSAAQRKALATSDLTTGILGSCRTQTSRALEARNLVQRVNGALVLTAAGRTAAAPLIASRENVEARLVQIGLDSDREVLEAAYVDADTAWDLAHAESDVHDGDAAMAEDLGDLADLAETFEEERAAAPAVPVTERPALPGELCTIAARIRKDVEALYRPGNYLYGRSGLEVTVRVVGGERIEITGTGEFSDALFVHGDNAVIGGYTAHGRKVRDLLAAIHAEHLPVRHDELGRKLPNAHYRGAVTLIGRACGTRQHAGC